MHRLQSLVSSRKFQQALPWVAGAVLVLGVVTYLQVLEKPKDSSPEAASNGPAKLINEPKTVPPSPEARKVVAEFIHTAVLRKNLAHAWQISGPNVRGGLTRKEWMTGNIPVTPYDLDPKAQPPVRLDWSYPSEASFAVTLLPRPGSEETKPQVFFVTAKKLGKGANAKWVVDYWAPYAPAAVPESFSR